MTNFSRLCLLAILTTLGSCKGSPENTAENVAEKDTTAVAPAKDSSVRPVHWGYSGESGPDKWAQLTPVYSLCGAGTSQSPVNLLANAPSGSPAWKMDYKTTSLQIGHNEHVEELINNGHTIQVTPQPGSVMTYEGKIYHLKQFHFHTPSEHTVGGKHSPMEIHFVHQADDKNLAVIGVLVEEGKANKTFEQLIRFLPNAPGEQNNHDSINIDIARHVPSEILAYHYVGSLTTPPCTENVQWMVLKNSVQMSREQLNAFETRLKNNNRPSQELNGRKFSIDDISSKK